MTATLEELFEEEPSASRAMAWTISVAAKADSGVPQLTGEMVETEQNSRVNPY